MSGYRMAKSIRISQKGVGGRRIEIDGELFPFYTANEPTVVSFMRGRLAQVTLTLMAEEIEVEADFTEEAELDAS